MVSTDLYGKVNGLFHDKTRCDLHEIYVRYSDRSDNYDLYSYLNRIQTKLIKLTHYCRSKRIDMTLYRIRYDYEKGRNGLDNLSLINYIDKLSYLPYISKEVHYEEM